MTVLKVVAILGVVIAIIYGMASGLLAYLLLSWVAGLASIIPGLFSSVGLVCASTAAFGAWSLKYGVRIGSIVAAIALLWLAYGIASSTPRIVGSWEMSLAAWGFDTTNERAGAEALKERMDAALGLEAAIVTGAMLAAGLALVLESTLEKPYAATRASSPTKTCPHCSRDVLYYETKCYSCGSDVREVHGIGTGGKPPFPTPSTEVTTSPHAANESAVATASNEVEPTDAARPSRPLTKRCLACDRTIKFAAIKCRYCRMDLPPGGG